MRTLMENLDFILVVIFILVFLVIWGVFTQRRWNMRLKSGECVQCGAKFTPTKTIEDVLEPGEQSVCPECSVKNERTSRIIYMILLPFVILLIIITVGIALDSIRSQWPDIKNWDRITETSGFIVLFFVMLSRLWRIRRLTYLLLIYLVPLVLFSLYQLIFVYAAGRSGFQWEPLYTFVLSSFFIWLIFRSRKDIAEPLALR